MYFRQCTLNSPSICKNAAGTDQPECSACHCPLTIMHILTECPALTSSIKDLFDNVAAQNILNFIKNPIFIALSQAAR